MQMKATFEDAKKICDSRQMDLLSVQSENEKKSIQGFLKSKSKISVLEF